jgi:hypothetical protein
MLFCFTAFFTSATLLVSTIVCSGIWNQKAAVTHHRNTGYSQCLRSQRKHTKNQRPRALSGEAIRGHRAVQCKVPCWGTVAFRAWSTGRRWPTRSSAWTGDLE